MEGGGQLSSGRPNVFVCNRADGDECAKGPRPACQGAAGAAGCAVQIGRCGDVKSCSSVHAWCSVDVSLGAGERGARL